MKRLIAALAVTAAAGLAPSVAGAQDTVSVTLVHGIPGATVDVAVDGAVVLPGFEPGTTQDLSPFAGQTLTNLEVRAAGTEDVVIGPVAEFAVPDSGNWSVIAHLDADGAPTINTFQNNVAPTADGEGRLIVRHTAAAPAVDLVVGDARPIEGAANGDSEELELPAGEIAGAQLAPAGGDPIVEVPTVNLAAGTDLIVYAVGSLDDDTFTFYTQDPIEVGTEAAAGGDEADDSADEGADDSADEGADDSADEGADDSADEGDGTPAPTAVNTGGQPTDGSGGPAPWVFALIAAAAALAIGGAAVRQYATARTDG